MINRDVNHPCIFMWVMETKEDGIKNIVPTLQIMIRKRHVIHPWADFNGLDTHHYQLIQTGPYNSKRI